MRPSGGPAVRVSIRPSAHQSVRPSDSPPDRPSVRSSVHQSFHPSVRTSIRPTVRVCPSVRLSVRLSVRQSVRPHVCPSVLPLFRPSVRQSVRPSVRLSCPSVSPSIRPSVRLCDRQSFHPFFCRSWFRTSIVFAYFAPRKRRVTYPSHNPIRLPEVGHFLRRFPVGWKRKALITSVRPCNKYENRKNIQRLVTRSYCSNMAGVRCSNALCCLRTAQYSVLRGMYAFDNVPLLRCCYMKQHTNPSTFCLPPLNVYHMVFYCLLCSSYLFSSLSLSLSSCLSLFSLTHSLSSCP